MNLDWQGYSDALIKVIKTDFIRDYKNEMDEETQLKCIQWCNKGLPRLKVNTWVMHGHRYEVIRNSLYAWLYDGFIEKKDDFEKWDYFGCKITK